MKLFRSRFSMRGPVLAFAAMLAVAGAGCASQSKLGPYERAMAGDAPAAYDATMTTGLGGVAAGVRGPDEVLPEPAPERESPTTVPVADRDDDFAKAPQDVPKKEAPAPPKDKSTGTGEGKAQGPGPGPGSGPGGVVADPSRKQPILIYRAEFSLSVYEVQKSLDAVDGLAKEVGGYLSRRDDHSITIRVPAEHFQKVVDSIAKVGDVLHRDVVSEDVTAEYRDLEVQLANLIALRARFEKLLEKAGKVEEALAIEQQLGRVTGEIERIKGRLKLLGDQARYSTITVRFEARSNQQVQQGPFVLPLPWLNQVGLRRLMSL
ncbi:MAG: DUF4349 domain-containing protein [Myxococcales bacterium]|nr:DUF4349 domain-containing protein [Myxococcales bacterium]